MSHQLLTNFPFDPLLDLPPWVGQRQATFRFLLINGVTGENLGEVHPIRNASLTHDTAKTIKRQLKIDLGVADTAAINPVSDRILVYMTFPNGTEYPLGRYMFTDNTKQIFTSGQLGSMVLNDEMFLVDQEIERGVNGNSESVIRVIQETMSGLPVTTQLEGSDFTTIESWSLGTGRGQILEALALTGDYFSPWFDHNGILRFIRSFEPAKKIPDLDFDNGNKVFREQIVETTNLLTAPNKFIVISNLSESSEAIVGIASIPPSAPHSEANRGFSIPQTLDLQVLNINQAQAMADNLAIRNNIFEQVAISTAPDPRHDSYNVIRWREELWLELSWSMALVEGGNMSHLLRKAYS